MNQFSNQFLLFLLFPGLKNLFIVIYVRGIVTNNEIMDWRMGGGEGGGGQVQIETFFVS